MAAKMAGELHSHYRWCVTGTPLQSGLNDIYGLLLFLGVAPWGIKAWWDRAVHRPWEAGRSHAKSLVGDALHRLLWRTAKVDVELELGIPPQTAQDHLLELDPVERVFYSNQLEKLTAASATFFSRHGSGPDEARDARA